MFIGFLAIFVLVLGMGLVSYAAFSYSKAGEKVNTITTGTIQMSYTESDNVISITNALPTTDATGKTRLKNGEYFDFSVTSTIQGNTAINWEIAATALSDSTFDGKNIKYYLTSLTGNAETEVMAPKTYNELATANEETGRPAKMMSLATGTSNATQTTNYRLRLWVNDAYNPQGDGGNLVYKTRINVYGKVQDPNALPMMKAYASGSKDDYHSDIYKSKVTSIVTKTDTLIPTTAIESWDVSMKGNNSVIAYVEDAGSGTYKVTIGGNNGIAANPDSGYVFSFFSAVTNIDLSHLDTSKVTSMNQMFNFCIKLTTLDISNFNTSNVTNMSTMFGACQGLTSLNLNHFDTSQVTTMYGMFQTCSNLTTLQIDQFDTTKVTDITNMFYNCNKLTEVTLGANWTNIPSLAFKNWNNTQTIKVAGTCASKTYITGWSADATVIWLDEPGGC